MNHWLLDGFLDHNKLQPPAAAVSDQTKVFGHRLQQIRALYMYNDSVVLVMVSDLFSRRSNINGVFM